MQACVAETSNRFMTQTRRLIGDAMHACIFYGVDEFDFIDSILYLKTNCRTDRHYQTSTKIKPSTISLFLYCCRCLLLVYEAMGSKKKVKIDKKKGPKGKKARAKAKLERQWGEVAIIDDEKSTKRIGNSRLLAQQKKKSMGGGVSWGGETTLERTQDVTKGEPTAPVTSKSSMKKTPTKKFERKNNRRRSNDGYSSSSDESSDKDSDDETMAMDILMSKIKKSLKKKKRAAKRAMETDVVEADEDEAVDTPMENEVSSDDDEESAGSSESEDEEGDDASIPDANAEVDDAFVENDEDESVIDIFRTRFSHKPLSSEEVDTISQPSRGSVSIGRSAELLLTRKSIGDELKDFETSEDDQSKLDEEYWNKCAMKCLESSRKVLSQRWKGFNKKKYFTSRQAPLYTALSSYADLFSISKTMKVCSFGTAFCDNISMEHD